MHEELGLAAGEHAGQDVQGLSAADRPSFSQRHLGTWLQKGSWTGKDPEGGEAELDAIRRGESQQIPVFKVAILLAMFAGEPPHHPVPCRPHARALRFASTAKVLA